MKLLKLLEGIGIPLSGGCHEITSITQDSRRVEPGALFFAVRGTHVDGHDFIDEAVARGASAIIAAKGYAKSSSVPIFETSDPCLALAKCAHLFYDTPSKKLFSVGITGTNGKTTTAFLIQYLLEQLGVRTGLLGTIQYDLLYKKISATRTTPDAVSLAYFLNEIVENGGRAVALEVSSHALEQQRVQELDFDRAIFTNLSQDHLDYHQNLEQYYLAKKKLFAHYLLASDKKNKWSVINLDDPFGRRLWDETTGSKLSYGLVSDALFTAKKIQSDLNGTSFVLYCPSGEFLIRMSLLGLHNVMNVLAAAAIVWSLGLSLRKALSSLEYLKVPGRLESFQTAKGARVFVDYAHTPDALKNVLQTLKELTKGKLFVVFGCGGERDQGKREKMGRIASSFADQVLLTSDNPRREDPMKIILDIQSGVLASKCRVELDRAQAIAWACEAAQQGDVVLVAGKGHETAQITGEKVIPFDDRRFVSEMASK